MVNFMLGTKVPVDSPFNSLFVTNLQCRNIRISVTNQKSIISMELYNEYQPIEQFNSNIIVPVKSIHDTGYNDTKSNSDVETSSDSNTTNSQQSQDTNSHATYSQTWRKDMQNYTNTSALKVPTLTSGDVNYLVGISSNHLKR
jgi:hypothetical protein